MSQHGDPQRISSVESSRWTPPVGHGGGRTEPRDSKAQGEGNTMLGSAVPFFKPLSASNPGSLRLPQLKEDSKGLPAGKVQWAWGPGLLMVSSGQLAQLLSEDPSLLSTSGKLPLWLLSSAFLIPTSSCSHTAMHFERLQFN